MSVFAGFPKDLWPRLYVLVLLVKRKFILSVINSRKQETSPLTLGTLSNENVDVTDVTRYPPEVICFSFDTF